MVYINPQYIANDIINKTQPQGPPFDFEKCLRYFKHLCIVQETLEGTGYLLDIGNDDAKIIVNRKSTIERQRFTAAHELGHWILKRKTQNREANLPNKTSQSSNNIERWCEKFAVSLLMPTHWIEMFLDGTKGVGDPTVLFFGPKHFLVSKEAFYLRLNDLYNVVVIERTAIGTRLHMQFYPKRFASEEAEHIIDAIGKRIFKEQLWLGAKGGFSCGPIQYHINKENVKIVLLLRGSADTASGVNSKLSRFSIMD
ncbi:MAG: ImmA/IrrE family metallo-endopeptidase [Euryarchaeota archaeon]|nr:ImmA/IrrE family metallo-endopeptidase [Euryarchaeota archaeon]